MFDWGLPSGCPQLLQELRIPKWFANDLLQLLPVPKNDKGVDGHPSLFIGSHSCIFDLVVDSGCEQTGKQLCAASSGLWRHTLLDGTTAWGKGAVRPCNKRHTHQRYSLVLFEMVTLLSTGGLTGVDCLSEGRYPLAVSRLPPF